MKTGGKVKMSDIIIEKKVFTTSNSISLIEKEMRLDAPYYSSTFLKAKSFLDNSSFQTVPLIDLCEDIYRLTRFKRIFTDKEHGYTYMAPSDLVYYRPLREREKPDRAYVAKGKHDLLANIKSALGNQSPTLSKIGEERYFVEEGWLLITCSGSMGRIVLTTKSLTDVFFSHDLIRIVPKTDTLIGYLYAYLSSWIGQAFISRDKYGGWIKHIEPNHIKSLPVLQVPRDVQERIHYKVWEAYEHRESFLNKEKSAIAEIENIWFEDASAHLARAHAPIEINESGLIINYMDMDYDVFYQVIYDDEELLILKNKEDKIEVYEVIEDE